jgi:molybdopterin converting factor small subunit
MKVNILYFAQIKAQLGTGQTLDLALLGDDAPQTVGQLRDWLSQQSAGHARALSPEQGLRAAYNQTLCEFSQPLSPDKDLAVCEVAFFPPVTGG